MSRLSARRKRVKRRDPTQEPQRMHLESGGTSKRKGHCHTSPDDHLHTCAQFSLALLQVEARSRLRDASGDKIQSLTQEADLEFKAEVQVDCPGYVAKRLILRAAQVVAA